MPAAERSGCRTRPGCGPWHGGKKQPAGTTPATPPLHQSSCSQMPCTPAVGEEREGGWVGTQVRNYGNEGNGKGNGVMQMGSEGKIGKRGGSVRETKRKQQKGRVVEGKGKGKGKERRE